MSGWVNRFESVGVCAGGPKNAPKNCTKNSQNHNITKIAKSQIVNAYCIHISDCFGRLLSTVLE